MELSLEEIAKSAGFESIEKYVEANLHYLPKESTELFRKIYAREYYGKG